MSAVPARDQVIARARSPVAIALVALVALIGLGAWLINVYIEEERQRDLGRRPRFLVRER